jgi:hypothetical protein
MAQEGAKIWSLIRRRRIDIRSGTTSTKNATICSSTIE